MAETASVSNIPRASTRNKFALVGRIDRVRKHEDQYLHTVTLPSEDEFGKTSVVQVRASRKLGDRGEQINVPVRVNGWMRPFTYTNKETGELEKGENFGGYFLVDGD